MYNPGKQVKFYVKRDDSIFQIVNFPFINNNYSNINSERSLHFTGLIRCSRGCAQYSEFLDRAQLLTQKLLKQSYLAPRLKSSPHKFCSRHHDLVDRYERSISQMAVDLFLLQQIVSFLYHQQDLPQVTDNHQQDLPQVIDNHQQGLPQVTDNHQQDLPQVTDNHQQDLPQVTDKLYHIKLYRVQLVMSAIDSSSQLQWFVYTDCAGSCKSNYHTITTTTDVYVIKGHSMYITRVHYDSSCSDYLTKQIIISTAINIMYLSNPLEMICCHGNYIIWPIITGRVDLCFYIVFCVSHINIHYNKVACYIGLCVSSGD